MRNRWVCRCKPQNTFAVPILNYQTTCRYNNCIEWHCKECGACLGGFGLAGCKCDGYIRELFHRDMRREEHPVPVKPSKLIRRNRKRRRGDRITKLSPSGVTAAASPSKGDVLRTYEFKSRLGYWVAWGK